MTADIAREDATAVVRRLADAGHVAYFAGGCVRDQVLGRPPTDYDVATSARPDVVRRLFPRSQGVGQAFGVVLVRERRTQIEVATFRADGVYTDGRHPDDVTFASELEDARRRDFTINGLFYDPLGDRVIDHVGGVGDIERGVIRAIGDAEERLAEDYLRMLRAVRFTARLGFSIDPGTQAAITVHATKLPRIAPERIADELRKMFHPPSRKAAIRLLDQVKLTEVLLRSLPAPASGTAVGSGHYVERLSEPASFGLTLTAWAIGYVAGKAPPTPSLAPALASRIESELRRCLRLSNEESATIQRCLAIELLLRSDQPPRMATMKRFLAMPYAADARDFLRSLASHPSLAEVATSLEAVFASFQTDDIAPPPWVTGDDLRLAGFEPGPKFKTALDAAYDAQLEHRVSSAADALQIAIRAINS